MVSNLAYLTSAFPTDIARILERNVKIYYAWVLEYSKTIQKPCELREFFIILYYVLACLNTIHYSYIVDSCSIFFNFFLKNLS